jgi:WD40 repeat protein
MKSTLAAVWVGLLLASACSQSTQPASLPSIEPVQEPADTLSVAEMTATSTIAHIGASGEGEADSEPARPTFTIMPTTVATQTTTPGADPAESGLFLEKTLQYSPWALVHDLTWSPDGAWFAAAAGESIYLYDGEKLESLRTLHVAAWANELQFLHSQRLPGWVLGLAARDGTLQFWDVDRGTLLVKFDAHNKAANSLAVSPDGRFVASSGNDAILRLWEQQAIWDLQVGEDLSPAAEMIGGAFAVPAVRFNADGSLVASIDLQAVRLRDPASARLVRTLHSEVSLFDLAFSPDGRYLATARRGSSLQVWQADAGESIAIWQTGEAVNAFLWDLVFSPDGNRICAVSNQGALYLWSFPDGELLAKVSAHTKAASAVAFSPDGMRLATGGLDGAVRLWNLALEVAVP